MWTAVARHDSDIPLIVSPAKVHLATPCSPHKLAGATDFTILAAARVPLPDPVPWWFLHVCSNDGQQGLEPAAPEVTRTPGTVVPRLDSMGNLAAAEDTSLQEAVEASGLEGLDALMYDDLSLRGRLRKAAQVHFYKHQVRQGYQAWTQHGELGTGIIISE